MAAGMIQPVYFGQTEEGNFGRLPVAPVYVHQDYPAFRFKADETGKMQQVIVQNEDEDKALGEGWSDRPDGPRSALPADEMEEFRKWKAEQAQAAQAVAEVTGSSGSRIQGTITLKNKGGRKPGSKNKPKWRAKPKIAPEQEPPKDAA